MANWIVENRITGEVAYAYGADQPDHFGTFPLDVITATVDTANKVITFSIKSSDTAGFSWKKGVYEAEVYSNADDKQRIAEGEVTISRELPP